MNIRDLLDSAAQAYQNKPLMYFKGEPIGYSEFIDQVHRLNQVLNKHGVKKGDRVAILMNNSPEWLISFFAAHSRGAIVVPINPALTASEVSYIVNDAKPAVLVVDASLKASLAKIENYPLLLEIADVQSHSQWHAAALQSSPLVERESLSDDDPAIILYTSGTTGRPKGTVLSHGANFATLERCGRLFRINAEDRAAVIVPLAFIYGSIIQFGASLYGGATIFLFERFHPRDTTEAIQREQINVFMGVPTIYVMMLNWADQNPVDLSSVRLFISSGSHLPATVSEQLRLRLGINVFEYWGMTEGTPITGYDPFKDGQGRPDSVGRELPDCEVRIVDGNGRDVRAGEIGELIFRSPSNMIGYLGNPQATAETIKDGWLYSGDLGKRDDEGFIYIVGREKDMIIRGGANIYPAEIEEVLYGIDGIAECAVVGAPDPVYGEVVRAFVVRRNGYVVDAAAIQDYCREHLAEYKIPTIVSFIDEVPKGPTGKILKRVLREQA